MRAKSNEWAAKVPSDQNRFKQASVNKHNIVVTWDFFAIEREMQEVAAELRQDLNAKLAVATQQMQQIQTDVEAQKKDLAAEKTQKIILLEREQHLRDEIAQLKQSISNLELLFQDKAISTTPAQHTNMDLNTLCDAFIIGTDLQSLRVAHETTAAKNKKLFEQSARKNQLDDLLGSYNQYVKLKTEIDNEIKLLTTQLNTSDKNVTSLNKEIDTLNKSMATQQDQLKVQQRNVPNCEAVLAEKRSLKENAKRTYDAKIAEIYKAHEENYQKMLTEYENEIIKANEKYKEDADKAKWFRDENIAKKNDHIASLRRKIDEENEAIAVEARKFWIWSAHRSSYEQYRGNPRPNGLIEACQHNIQNNQNDIENIKREYDDYIEKFRLARTEKEKQAREAIDILKSNKDPELKKLLQQAQASHEKIANDLDNQIVKAGQDLKKAKDQVAETENAIKVAGLSLESAKNNLKKNQTEITSIKSILANKNQIAAKLEEKISSCQEKMTLLKAGAVSEASSGVMTEVDSVTLKLNSTITAESLEELATKRKRLAEAEQEMYTLKLAIQQRICPQDSESEISLMGNK